jgi:hypothetical protein
VAGLSVLACQDSSPPPVESGNGIGHRCESEVEVRGTSSLTKDFVLHPCDSLLKVCVHGRARRQHTSSRADVGEIGMALAGAPG